jgi:L-ascorbate metabolism protein UlaG (beta-lactamase superfamily)
LTGYIIPEEIKNLEVVVFVSHDHFDHFNPTILSWQSVVKNITFVFGWKTGFGGKAIDLPEPRSEKRIGDMEIFTVNDTHVGLPEVAYIVKVDGITIYHAGDYFGSVDGYKPDMKYLLKKGGKIDLGFISSVRQVESLLPRYYFPSHELGFEYRYNAQEIEIKAKNIPTQVIISENRGDRYFYSNNKLGKQN